MGALHRLAAAALRADEGARVVVNPGEVRGDAQPGGRDDGDAETERAVAHPASAFWNVLSKAP